MYLHILKKDLRRKRAMNVILLVFITLAAMFVSSSVNNIISVTMALDDYFEMADVPDYAVMSMNKSGITDPETTLEKAAHIDSFQTEDIIFLSNSNILRDGNLLNAATNTQLLQSDETMGINYFLDDNRILKSVPKGQFYVTAFAAKNAGLEIGDAIVIELEGVKKEFTYAGSIKDAVLGSEMNKVARFIINAEDFAVFSENETVFQFYGGKGCYIHTSDMDKMLSEIAKLSESFAFAGDRALIRFTYVFDMVVTGVLLVISIMLIAVAFVVLRFTITFTISEEFREIGVMKAIGISDLKIRGLYLTKYAALAVIGTLIGLVLSYPFGQLLMSVASKSIIFSNQNTAFINVICAVFVVGVILFFCFGCTAKVKKMTPIDAVRSGQTGERYHKKSFMSLGKSRLNTTLFLAVNDVASNPKRYGIITLTFFLCLSLLLVLSATVTTLKSDTLLGWFSCAGSDLFIDNGDETMRFMTQGGRDMLEEYLADLETELTENGMPAKCMQEYAFNLPVRHGEWENKISIQQGTGTTMDQYVYTAGTVPQNSNEIAITKLAADSIKADIGDTVTITTADGDKGYIITAFFQTMNQQGVQIRFHTDVDIDYIQASGAQNLQIQFTDAPDDEEISNRIEKIKTLYPEFVTVQTAAENVKGRVGVADAMAAVKTLSALLTIILSALVTVLMERSFIAKEQGEIALMKAVGMKNGKIYAYHAARFAVVGVLAVIVAEVFAMPLTHLCIDPIFKMMGMENVVNYVTSPFEIYLLFPLIILMTTVAGAFLTSLYTRRIVASDTADIE